MYFHFQSLWTNSQLHGKDVIMWRISSLSVNKRKELIFCGMGMSHGSGCPICWQPPSTLCKYLFHYPFNPKYQKKFSSAGLYICLNVVRQRTCSIAICGFSAKYLFEVFFMNFLLLRKCVSKIYLKMATLKYWDCFQGSSWNMWEFESDGRELVIWCDHISDKSSPRKKNHWASASFKVKVLFSKFWWTTPAAQNEIQQWVFCSKSNLKTCQ